MKYRKLRIAWSVAWGVMAVLVCVMWVRSYWRGDYVNWVRSAPHGIQFKSFNGYFEIEHSYNYGRNGIRWSLNRISDNAPIFVRYGLNYTPRSCAFPIWLPGIFATLLSVLCPGSRSDASRSAHC